MHWWRHRSDRTKIGDIKKTVAAFSLQHGVYTQLKPPSLNTLKSCKTKTNPKFGGALFSRTSEFSTHQNNLILAFHQFEAHWLSKTISVIPRLFKEDFVLTFFESEAKHRFCHRGCRSVWNQTARIWPLCLLSLGRSARSRHNAWGSLTMMIKFKFTSSHQFLSSSSSVCTVGKTSGHVPSWFGSTRKSWLPSRQKSSLKDALHTPKSNVAVKINPINFTMFANLDWIEYWYDAHLL